MSINVTVHGNPISIKKGKMVTCDSDSEFERRRRIRLQQVRQQSKEIAADVRNRVRKEKEKQLSKAEQKGEQDLKRWQARKLLALQQQYEDCLKEVGSAHTKAALEPDAGDILYELAAKNKAEAHVRGKIAAEKKRKETEQIRMEQEIPIELKKNARKIEDARSTMVTKINQGNFSRSPSKKKKKKKKIATDVTITNNFVNESDSSENFISDEENISANISENKSLTKQNKKQLSVDLTTPDFSVRQSQNKRKSHSSSSTTSTNDSSLENASPPNLDYIVPESPRNKNDNRSILSENMTPSISPEKLKKKRSSDGYKLITKISDRIQQRKLPEPVEEVDEEDNNFHFIHNIPKPEKYPNSYKPKLQIESYKICDIQSEPEQSQPTTSLPYVPKTSLRPESYPSTIETQVNKVKYYDHLNHFSKEYSAQPVVQKVNKNSIHAQPESDRSDSLSDLLKTVQTRDKIAHDRGVRAMEKEKIHKDYKQLMEELPILQRQERLASMRSHNPAFHMPEDRLQELERRRQSKIENIFEKYYHKSKYLETPLITIRPVQKSPPGDEMRLPFRALDVTESPPVQLNVAEWKTNDKQDSTGPLVQEEDLQSKQKALVDLLQRVNKQRELLLQEVATLPENSNLQKILQDEEVISLICPGAEDLEPKTQPEKTKKTLVSTGTNPLSVKTPSKNKHEKGNNKRRPSNSSSSDSSTEVIKKKKNKKAKNKKQKILIRNEGTQTSPIVTSSKSTSPKAFAVSEEQSQKTCSCKTSCKCCGTENNAEKLCEIIIKMNNQADVELCNNEKQSPNKRLTLNVNKPTKISIRSPTIGNDASSSTTYMSLPEIQNIISSTLPEPKNFKPSTLREPKKFKPSTLRESKIIKPKQRQEYKDSLHHKPQQTNVDCTDRSQTISPTTTEKKEITPTLLRYIQKLLSMSRKSIDELTVSSISDVSTPGSSTIDIPENSNPFLQLQNVMQYYNLSFSDIQKHLTSSVTSQASNESPKEIGTEAAKEEMTYTRASSTVSVKVPKEPIKRKSSPRDDKEIILPPQIIHQSQKSLSLQSSSSVLVRSPQSNVEVAELVKETFGLIHENAEEIPYANILCRYKDLTTSCCDRISKLTEMINNVRLEKERLLSPDTSDKYETSVTSYLDLPKMTNDSTRVESNENKFGRHSNSSSASSSMTQDEVDRYLLAIDNVPSQQTSPTRNRNSVVDEIVELPVSDKPNNKNKKPENFVPMLQGIPKYTEPSDNQAMNYLNSPVKQYLQSVKTKPPPALMRNAYKYNLNMTPHELSTIVELDTVASPKNVSDNVVVRARSPKGKVPSSDETVQDTSKNDDESGFITITPQHLKIMSKKQKDLKRKPKKSSLKKTSESTSPVSNTGLSEVQPINSDRSSSSPEDMEKMLRSMGLGWAVSTLKKTHEALALSSTSSSSVEGVKRRVSFKESSSSNSEVSLIDVLSTELIKKITSSTLLSDSSGISPHLQELQDISEIKETTVSNKDNQQRTSTPVHQSKSTDSKKEFFSGDSDLSSVRLQNEELFLSIPNVSLDTNKSLSKSKE